MDSTHNNKASTRQVLSVVFRVILALILAFLLFVAGTLAYDKFVNKSRIPSFFGKSVLIIATPSMADELQAGDMVVIEKSDSYKVGDIITYFPASEQISVTHRIVRIEGDKFYAKGDANNTEDPDPVYQSQIVGKTVRVLPKVGIVVEWLRTWQGIAFMVAIAVLVVTLIAIAGRNDDVDDIGDVNELSDEEKSR